jgi:diaminopimelate epimerase
MRQLTFCKLQASGNDFVLIDALEKKPFPYSYSAFAKKFCPRKTGIGADGVLVIEPSKKALFKMRVINADGSEAQMCGNGARCAGLWARSIAAIAERDVFVFETAAGNIEAEACAEEAIKVKTTTPSNLKMNIPIEVFGRKIRVNFINTGVPHVVVFVQGIGDIDVNDIGREIRFHKKFAPRGVNVNFVEVISDDSIKIRTYERGVEAETLACGTGSIASAVITGFLTEAGKAVKKKIKVGTKGGEVLNVYIDKAKAGKKFDVKLEGKAALVYMGICQV